MRLLLATRNPGKAAEIRALLLGLPIEIIRADEIEGLPEVDETAPTLEGNARKKARELHEFSGLPALADDTGLEIEALNGRPGVYSARYGGEPSSDANNRTRVLRELQTVGNRKARFRTVMAFAVGGTVRLFEGICNGEIIEEERGDQGFGYDSIFVPEGYEQTFAEMSAEEKNAISHRKKALAAFVEYLSSSLASS